MIKKYKQLANAKGYAKVCGTKFQIIDGQYYADGYKVTLNSFRRLLRRSLLLVSDETAKIPQRIKDLYRIQEHEGQGLSIHHPSYINIDWDERFLVNEGNTTIEIRNKYVSVELWKHSKDGFMHITVFRHLT